MKVATVGRSIFRSHEGLGSNPEGFEIVTQYLFLNFFSEMETKMPTPLKLQ
jgi:hypothetical protein